jgi:hypothetical protein
MSTPQLGAVLRHLRRITSNHGGEQQPDRELLERYARRHDGDAFAPSMPGQPASVATRADGKFQLAGLGRERVVGLIVEGPGIAYARLQAMTRAGEPVVSPDPYRPQRIYGATFEYLAAPSRPIRGVVRVKETGKPVAGVRIETTYTTHAAHTDRAGRYELLGYPKSREYRLLAVPVQGEPYFMANASIADTPGLAPLDADIQLARGALVSGRVTDKSTGKPIQGARVDATPSIPTLTRGTASAAPRRPPGRTVRTQGRRCRAPACSR